MQFHRRIGVGMCLYVAHGNMTIGRVRMLFQLMGINRISYGERERERERESESESESERERERESAREPLGFRPLDSFLCFSLSFQNLC